MVNLNLNIILVQMAGFLLLLFILNIILYRPVLSVLRKRRETLNSMLNEANLKKEKAKENENLYNQRLSEAENKAKEEYKNIVSSALSMKEKRLEDERKKAKEELEMHRRDIEAHLEEEKEKALSYSKELSEMVYSHLVG